MHIQGCPIKTQPLKRILYWKREIVQNIKELLQLFWKWPPSTFAHNFNRLMVFWKTRWSWRGVITVISAWIRCFSSAIFTRSCSKTLFLRWPHNKKSRGVRSGLLGCHKGKLTSRSPKNSRKNSIVSRAVCTGNILLEHAIMFIFFQEGNELGDCVFVYFSINPSLVVPLVESTEIG